MNLSALAYIWLALIAGSGILGQWRGGEWEDAWRLLALALVLGLMWEWWLSRHSAYSVTRDSPSLGYLGEPCQYSLVIGNPGRDRLRLEIQQAFPHEVAGDHAISRLTVGAGAERTLPCTAVPRALGLAEWQPLYTRALGRLGIAWWPRTVTVPGALEVHPGRLRNHERGIGVQDQGELAQRTAGAGKELLWMREYQHGDPIRSIDWKATARNGRPIVRVFTEEQHVELMLLIDAGKSSGLQAGPLSRLNHYVNVAARLAEKAFGNGDQVGLVAFADQPLNVLPPVRPPHGLTQVRRALENLRPEPREANPLPATLLARRLLRRRSLVVIFTETDDSDTAGQLLQATQLLSSKHMPLVAGIIDPDLVALQHEPARDWLDPYHVFAASESLHASRLNSLKLQRMGALVAVANPAQLDGAVLHQYQSLRSRKRV